MSKSRKLQRENTLLSKKHSKLVNVISWLICLIFIAALLFILCLIIKPMGIGIYDFMKWCKNKLSKLDSVIVVTLITGTVSLISVLITSVVSKII